MALNDRIRATILKRASRLQHERVYDLVFDRPFILAGGALCGDPVHDFDIYPAPDKPFSPADVAAAVELERTGKGALDVSVVARTKNAVTVLLSGGQKVQFCSYLKPSLEELVGSFDYSHVQVGVRFPAQRRPPDASCVYYTDEFVLANVTRETEYTGSEYPLSSVVRALKYYKRGKMTRATASRSILKAMADLVRRGYNDYADFKDQLDAIDLGLPDGNEARELWEAVREAKLVKPDPLEGVL